MNKKYWIFLVIGLFLIAAAVTWNRSKGADAVVTKTDKPVVSVTTFTLYETSKAVAGESLDVRPIIPLGTDAHMFSPNPRQVAEISESAFFVFNGAGFEPWTDALEETLPKEVRVIDMSAHVDLLSEEEGDHDHEEGHAHAHGAYDPHYWLDIENMIKMTRTIETAFSERFPENAGLYRQNAQKYIAELEALKREYAAALSECKNRILVSNHDAFGYLAHANGLENVSVIGLSSDEQPSAKNIAEIIALVKEHGIKTIFFEEFINDNVAQTIAGECGVEAHSLQPLENISEDELKSHETYLSIMRNNLSKLKAAMECR